MFNFFSDFQMFTEKIIHLSQKKSAILTNISPFFLLPLFFDTRSQIRLEKNHAHQLKEPMPGSSPLRKRHDNHDDDDYEITHTNKQKKRLEKATDHFCRVWTVKKKKKSER